MSDKIAEMSLQPELLGAPRVAYRLHQADHLTERLIASLCINRSRSIVEDSQRVFEAFSFTVSGQENIPRQNGCLVVINHPAIETLVPAVFALAHVIYQSTQRTDLKFLLGSGGIPTIGEFGKLYLPGSKGVIKRLTGIYPENIALVETDLTAPDRSLKRLAIKKATLDNLKAGKMVILTPEAQVEIGNVILKVGKPQRAPRHGSGELAIEAAKMGLPQLPVGVWENQTGIHLKIGPLFTVASIEPPKTAMELMAHIATLMPEELRGPFA